MDLKCSGNPAVDSDLAYDQEYHGIKHQLVVQFSITGVDKE